MTEEELEALPDGSRVYYYEAVFIKRSQPASPVLCWTGVSDHITGMLTTNCSLVGARLIPPDPLEILARSLNEQPKAKR